MLAFLAALFVVVSLVEIYLFVLVGQAIGALNTIALVIVISLTGAWLAKREGVGVWNRLRTQLDEGKMPTNELIDGVLILMGGVMLVVPGFITDFCGLCLLFPPTRSLVRGFVRRRLRLRVYGFDVTPPIGRWTQSANGHWAQGQGPTDQPPPEDVIDV